VEAVVVEAQLPALMAQEAKGGLELLLFGIQLPEPTKK
jgi:hypothetical protein